MDLGTVSLDVEMPVIESQPLVVCAWHLKHFGEPLILKQGDPAKRSDGCCDACLEVEMEEIRKMRAAHAA